MHKIFGDFKQSNDKYIHGMEEKYVFHDNFVFSGYFAKMVHKKINLGIPGTIFCLLNIYCLTLLIIPKVHME